LRHEKEKEVKPKSVGVFDPLSQFQHVSIYLDHLQGINEHQ